MNQQRLAYNFATGSESGTASNLKITTDRNGDRIILGYGHAIYAAEVDGSIYVFGTRNKGQAGRSHLGWGGYSVSTTHQLGKIQAGIRKSGREFTVVDSRPRTRVTSPNAREAVEGEAKKVVV